MTTMIDTKVAVAVLRGRPRSVRERYRSAVVAGEEIWLSSISLFELWYGVARSTQVATNTERLSTLLAGPINVIGFNTGDAARAGHLRAALAGNGNSVGPYDLLIAAHAVGIGATLVTANVREFGRVDGLTVEDWTRRN